MDNDSDRKVEIEEKFTISGSIILEIYERPDIYYIQEPQNWKDVVDATKLIQKYLPKQTDIDKILDIIKKKSFEGNAFAPYYQRDPSRLLN